MRKTFRILQLAILLIIASNAVAQPIYQSFKFNRFMEYLDKYYVDSIDAEEVVEKAITKTLEELDPHSVYITEEDFKKMNEPLEGNFEGVGIQFNIFKDTLMVISPISGGPSEKVGILAGDRIIKVDGKNVAGIGLTNEDVFTLLRGKKGTEVNVSILRKSYHPSAKTNDLIDFTITRDKIPIFSLDASYMIDDESGYIKLNRFSATTNAEFSKALSELQEQGVKNLILDLTGNGGGYLEAAVNLADEFLTNDRMIVYTEGINSPRQEFKSSSRGDFEKGKLIVLIDEGSASASEIVTGAVQDWDRAIVIGRRSFGKGLVQRQLLLPDRSAIRLTTSRYYTPSGRLIQKPYDDGIDKYQHEISERFEHGEFMHPDSISFPDSLKYKTLVKQRTVFGGGGIMPDIFVPFDTNAYTDYYRDLVRKATMHNFALTYLDNNREELSNKYPDFKMFNEQFKLSQEVLDELHEQAKKDNIKVSDTTEIKDAEPRISLLIKAYIARDLFTRSEFYQILNEEDESYLKALEVIKDWKNTYSEVFQ